MAIGINSNDYTPPIYTRHQLTREESAKLMFETALAQGATPQEAQEAKEFYLRFGDDSGEQSNLNESKEHRCDKLSQISDELWKELLANYDMERLSYEDKKKLAKDFEKHGLLSAEESKKIVNQFDRLEELEENKKPPIIIEYDKEKYPTISDYIRDNLIEASPEVCAALKESMLAKNKFEHIIEHMKNM